MKVLQNLKMGICACSGVNLIVLGDSCEGKFVKKERLQGWRGSSLNARAGVVFFYGSRLIGIPQSVYMQVIHVHLKSAYSASFLQPQL